MKPYRQLGRSCAIVFTCLQFAFAPLAGATDHEAPANEDDMRLVYDNEDLDPPEPAQDTPDAGATESSLDTPTSYDEEDLSVPGTATRPDRDRDEAQEGTAEEPADDDHDHAEDLDYEELFVTAKPHSRRQFDVIQGTTVLSGDELLSAARGTIGETLAQEPGISSTYFGPGASRPVIRGLDGPRVRVLNNGVGTIDASTTSPDHAVAGEPLLAKRIEVVRGAGTLLYGSSAIGGVVNVLDGRVPDRLPEDLLDGSVVGLFGSAATEGATAGEVTGGYGPVVLHAEGAFRDTQDLDIPGFAFSRQYRDLERAEDPDDFDPGPYGTAPNSDLRNWSWNVGGSLVGDIGHFGAAYGQLRGDYGVPSAGHAHGHEEEHEDEEDHDENEHGEEEEVPVRIQLEQERVDFGGDLDLDWGLFESTLLRVAHADYEHTEFEGTEVGTIFRNDGWEGRLDLVQQPFGDLHGTVGFQFVTRDFEAIGEEAFTPPSDTYQFALFAVEEYHLEPFTFEAGLRYEHTSIQATSNPNRSFDTVSFSVGTAWAPTEDYLLGVSLSRTERPPTAEELYSFGPHLATQGFEIGNPDLHREAGLTIETTARKRHGRLTGSLNFFYTWFDDFIFQQIAGEEMDELPVRRYVQDPAEFIGGEFEITAEVLSLDCMTGLVDFGMDYVYARETKSGDPLPRIPPFSLFSGVGMRSDFVDGRFEVRWARKQDRVAENELPTDDYLLLNLRMAFRPIPDHQNVTLTFDALNLLDRDARVHSSFVKDFIPLPGRDFRVGLQMTF